MSRLIVVFGATGNQGSSVVRHILDDPDLSQTYKIRAVTRNKANAIGKFPDNVDVVAANMNDKLSLLTVLRDAHTVFALTTTNYAGSGGHSEIDQGRNLVDAAIESDVQMLIWSTLPSPSSLSDGKYRHVASFEAKAEIEKYIRSKNVRSAFYSPGSFMQNFATFSRPQPDPQKAGSYIIFGVVASSTQLPLVDIARDTGLFVTAILADPDAFLGKTVYGASALYSMDDQARLISHSTGRMITYQQLPPETFKSFLPPNNAQELLEMNLYQEEYGYYGPETALLVTWSVAQAKREPVKLSVFLERNPLNLA